MKTLLIAGLLALLPATAFAIQSTNAVGSTSTNTFVLRPGRPATADEVRAATNQNAWVTPYTLPGAAARVTKLGTNSGYIAYGVYTNGNWDLIDQWFVTGPLVQGSTNRVSLVKGLTNAVYNISIFPMQADGGAGLGNETVSGIKSDTNFVQFVIQGYVEWISSFVYIRVVGK